MILDKSIFDFIRIISMRIKKENNLISKGQFEDFLYEMVNEFSEDDFLNYHEYIHDFDLEMLVKNLGLQNE